MNKTRMCALLALCVALLADSRPAAAQNFPVHATPEKGVWMETWYTGFDVEDAEGYTAVSFLLGRLPLSERFSAVADVPFSHARIDSSVLEGGTSRQVGNPYIGVEFTPTKRLMLELGTRAPVSPSGRHGAADRLAASTDRMRPEAHASDMVPVSVAATIRQTLPAGMALRARGGATRLIVTGDGPDESMTALDYGLAGSYAAGPAQLGLGVVGRWYRTALENVTQTSFHQATVGADIQAGRVRPGASLRVPLDCETRALFNPSIGVHLQVPLR